MMRGRWSPRGRNRTWITLILSFCVFTQSLYLYFKLFKLWRHLKVPRSDSKEINADYSFKKFIVKWNFYDFQTNIQIGKFLTIRLSVTKNHRHSIILKTDWLKVGCILFKFSMGSTSFSAFSPGRLLPAPWPWYATEEIIIILWGFHWWLSTWVPSLILEDPIHHGATKPAYHNFWACALWLESEHCNEQPGHRN